MVNFLTSIGLDGATILQKSWHGGKPKTHHHYPPWPVFDNSTEVYKELVS
jgi:hypothetical protein